MNPPTCCRLTLLLLALLPALLAAQTGSSSLQLITPQGGELFEFGDTITIRWVGSEASDTLAIDYSSDDGATWTRITDTATGDHYRWTIPATWSRRCRMRISRRVISGEWSNSAIMHGVGSFNARFLMNDTRVLSVDADATARVWDAATGSMLHHLDKYGVRWSGVKTVQRVSISPDEKLISTTFNNDSGTIIWNAATGEQITTLSGGYETVFGQHRITLGAFSPDSRSILLNNDFSTREWKIESREIVRVFEPYEFSVIDNIYVPGGERILMVTSVNNPFYIWDAKTGALIFSPLLNAQLTDYSLSADGTMMLMTTSRETTLLYNIVTGELLHSLKINNSENIAASAFSPDGKRFAVVSGPIIVFNVADGRQAYTIPPGPAPIRCMDFTPDGSRIIAGLFDGHIIEYDANTGRAIDTLVGHTAIVRSISLSNDGIHMVSACDDSTVRVWTWMPNAVVRIESATSQQSWSIASARPTVLSDTVDFGDVIVGTSRDTVVPLFSNERSAEIFITSHGGPRGGRYEITSGGAPVSIAPTSTHSLGLRFSPSKTIVYSDYVNFRIAGRDTSIDLVLIGKGIEEPVEPPVDPPVDPPVEPPATNAFFLEISRSSLSGEDAAIRFGVDKPAHVRLTIHDVLGKTVGVLVDEPMDAGSANHQFATTGLPVGYYFVHLQSSDGRSRTQILMIR